MNIPDAARAHDLLRPFWTASWPALRRLDHDLHADVVVVGGGITGATAALRLAESGVSVVVVTASQPARTTTGLSTGKVSLLQGERLAQVRAAHGADVLGQYVAANRAGLDWIEARARAHDVPFDVLDDVSVAYSDDEMRRLDEVLEAATAAGLAVALDASPQIEGAVAGVVLHDQIQLNPSALLAALHRELVERGVRVFGPARVRAVRRTKPLSVVLDATTVTAEHVVLATGAPFGRLGALYARVEAARSYLTAWRGHGPVSAMSIGLSGGSIRATPGSDGEVLLVGGQGHAAGRGGSSSERIERLSRWAHEHADAHDRLAAWGAQDYVSASHLPLVGRATPAEPRLLTATGYGKWGLTNGAAAGMALADTLLGNPPPWAETFDPWNAAHRHDLRPSVALTTAAVRETVQGWAASIASGPATVPAPDSGSVCRLGASVVARSSVEGRRRSVSAVCPHLGGVVRWNDGELSWDCPVHGSRFAPDGSALEGPTTEDLRPRSPDPSTSATSEPTAPGAGASRA